MPFPVELARSSALEVSRLIRDFKENVDSGNPTYLRDGNPESYIGKLNLATARRSCRKWASQGIGQNAGTDAVMDGFCKPYLEDIGQYPGEPTAGANFTGGQCPGVEYRWTLTNASFKRVPCDGGSSTTVNITDRTQSSLFGPLRGPVSEVRTQGDCGVTLYDLVLYGKDSNGNEASFRITQWGPGNPALRAADLQYDLSVERIDGQPDVCGDPEPDIRPPDPVPDPGPPSPITIAPDFDVDIDVEFFPDGTFNIKFNFGGEGTDPGDDPVEVPIDPTPETREPGGEPGDPTTGTPGSEEEGEADEGEILVGVLVEIDSVPPNANVLFTEAGPVYKGPYYVYLGVEDRLDLQPEGSVARQTQFYFAPPDSTHWRVTANSGYTTTITPYYKPINEA